MTTTVDVTLRDLHWTDIEAVVALESELFPDDAWTPASLWAELAGRPRRSYVVAYDADGDSLGLSLGSTACTMPRRTVSA